MAFKSVKSESSFVSLTALTEGASVEGFLVGVVDSPKIVGQRNLIMIINGARQTVNSAGNIKYLLQDNLLEMGLNTRITRIADKQVKGKRSSQFAVEQDPDNRVEVAQTVEPSQQATPKPMIQAKNLGVAEKLRALKEG